MTSHPRRLRTTLGAVLLSGVLLLAACGDDDDTSATDDSAPPAATDESADGGTTDGEMTDDMTDGEMTDDMTDGEMTDDMTDGEMAMLDPSGPGCAAVPADGEGSFSGMADDPAATAASNNPALSTLVSAVQAAGLVDTLNGEGPFTIFAPTNDAFAAIPAADLDAVLADTELLTTVLTNHVVAGEQWSSADLIEAGSATTVAGTELTFAAGPDGGLMVNDATGVCIDVPTANATVHIIDTVLLPAG